MLRKVIIDSNSPKIKWFLKFLFKSILNFSLIETSFAFVFSTINLINPSDYGWRTLRG